jgi:hypothetical protein
MFNPIPGPPAQPDVPQPAAPVDSAEQPPTGAARPTQPVPLVIDWISAFHLLVLLGAAAGFCFFGLCCVVMTTSYFVNPNQAQGSLALVLALPAGIEAAVFGFLAFAAGVALRNRRRILRGRQERKARIAAYKEQFRSQTTAFLKAQADLGGLKEEAAIALQEVLNERDD